MDIDERMACSMWAKNAILKSAGEGDPISTFEGFAKNAEYSAQDWMTCLMDLLPEELAVKINYLAMRCGGFWNAWPLLNDAELGIVMKAGAINFFTEIDDETRAMIDTGEYRVERV